MLIGFTVENYRSFFGEASLSMVATSDKEYRAFNVISGEHGDLLKNILVYGANAGGKSNLISALYFMKKMITSSIDVQTAYIKSCRHFTFIETAANIPTKFEISFVLDNAAYDYGFSILGEKINSEYLYKKAKRRTLVFERTAPDYNSIRLMPDMADVEPLKKNVRDDVLFLSWAAYTNNALGIKIVDWISNKLIIFGLNGSREQADATSAFARSFVQKADSSILELNIRSGNNLVSSHRMYREGWDEKRIVEVPFEEYSSEGTKRMLDLADGFSKAIADSAVIVIDEMDLHLHPSLVRHLIALINSIAYNPNNTQLICTTHDVLLLDEEIRRDQIWFVEKNEHSASSLYALSDFKDVRKNSDILKRYLLGVYGAIPNFSGGANE
jgi:AAA15 family ATPase/GTPase